jgi:molybdate transport system regulatory protein
MAKGKRAEKGEPNRYQDSHPTEPRYAAKGKIWVERGGEAYIGFGRARLLETIDRLGSIAAAARSMGMGYRNAWLEVQTMNRLASTPLVEKATGGAGGGHAMLTGEGHRVLNEYRQLRARFQAFLKKLE